jgi:hypothetical protein
MRRTNILLFLAGLIVALVAGYAYHGFTRRHSREYLEREASRLRSTLDYLRSHQDAEHLHWYYAFREVEEPDERAWDLAIRKLDTEIAAKSNALARVEAQLIRMHP